MPLSNANVHHHSHRIGGSIQRYWMFVYSQSWIRNINHMLRTLPRAMIWMILIDSILALGQGIGSFFFTVFIWKQTESLFVIGMYYLIQILMVLLLYIGVGIWLFRLQLKQIIQLGLFGYMVSYVLILIFQDNLRFTLVLVSLLSGSAMGLYWSANKILHYRMSTDTNRDRMNCLTSAFSNIIAVLSPIIATTILTLNSDISNIPIHRYYLLFSFTVIVFIVAILLSIKLPNLEVPPLNLSGLLSPLKTTTWRIIGVRTFLEGFKWSTEVIVGGVLLYVLFQSEYSIGILSTYFALGSVIAAFAIGLSLTRDRRLLFGGTGSVLLFASRFLYVSLFTVPALITAAIINLFADPLFGLGLAATYFDAIDHSPKHQKNYYAYIVFDEMLLTFGRVCGAIIITLSLYFLSDIVAARLWFLVISIIPLLYFLLTVRFEKDFERGSPAKRKVKP